MTDKIKLRRIALRIEKKACLEGHDWCGEWQCSFCGMAGRGDIEHRDGCPMGDLWLFINAGEGSATVCSICGKQGVSEQDAHGPCGLREPDEAYVPKVTPQ